MTPKEHAEVFAQAAKTFRALTLMQRGQPAEQYWTLMRLCEVLAQSYGTYEGEPTKAPPDAGLTDSQMV